MRELFYNVTAGILPRTTLAASMQSKALLTLILSMKLKVGRVSPLRAVCALPNGGAHGVTWPTGSRSQCTTELTWGLSMNRRFGVPALAGPGRLKAGHQTDLATQSGSGSQCTTELTWGLSMNLGLVSSSDIRRLERL